MSQHASTVDVPLLSQPVLTRAEDAITLAGRWRDGLLRRAAHCRPLGRMCRDQDVPDHSLVLMPGRPRLRPLVLIGGMGPLAGLEGFIAACRLFGDTRTIALYQACGVPDRTGMLLDGRRDELVAALADATARALALLGDGQGAVDTMLLCNTAHAVLPDLIARLERDHPALAVRLRFWSLVDGVMAAVGHLGIKRPLLLSTRGSRQSRLFAGPLSDAGLVVEEPEKALQDLLDRAVYEGVKAGDPAQAVALAAPLFTMAAERHPQADAILAGCTEVPVLRQWLGDAGGPPLLDPVMLTLQANAQALQGPQETTIAERFFTVAERFADRPALSTPAGRRTYGELAATVRAIAAGLLARLGAGADPVAILCDGRGETIPAMLGVLAAGRAYVPVDAAAPAARARLILADAGAVAVLAAPEHLEMARAMASADCAVIELAGLSGDATIPLPGGTADDFAYILYTSGSTGRPKGVVQDQRYVLTLVDHYTASAGIGPDDRLALVSSLAFSASVRDVYCTLLNGAELYCWDVPAQGLDGLASWMGQCGITLFFAVASLYRAFARILDPAQVPSLRMVQVGSESVYGSDLALFQRHFPAACRLMVNLGSTELSPVRQALLGHGDPLPEGAVPLDLPVAGNELLLLDANGQPVSKGDAGDIAVRGRALSPGYWRQPALTLAALRPDALGHRRYLTGDRGRLLPDGRLLHLGRADNQIKLRGYRVDPAEVEAALRALDGVRDAAVTVDPAGEGALYGYVVPVDPANPPTEQAIRRALLARLPEVMVPARLMLLAAMPLGATGKIDRRALPPPPPPVSRAPETPTEQRMAALWQDVLGFAVGADDSLLLVGGSSLAAARIAARLPGLFGVRLPIAAIFQSPTIAALSARIDAGEGQGAEDIPLPLPSGADAPLSPGQRAFWLADQLDGPSANPIIARAWNIQGPLSVDRLRLALNALVARHDVLSRLIVDVDGTPVTRPAPPAALLTVENIGAPVLDAAMRAAWSQPFDLGTAPPVRFHLWHLGQDRHVLLVCLHHGAGDDAATLVLARDLAALYAAAGTGEPPSLPPLPFQVGDHAAWLAGRADAVRERWAPWWRAELQGAPPELDLPYDRPRERGYQPGAVPVALDAGATAALKALAHRQGATLYAGLLASFAALLARLSGNGDIIVGAPLSRRHPPATEDLVGCFVQTLPLRLRPDAAADFTAPLDQAARLLPRAIEAGELSFDEIVAATAPDRPAGRLPLVQAMLTLVENAVPALLLPGLETAALPLPKPTAGASTDLTLSLLERQGRLEGWLEFNALLFDTATVRAMADLWQAMLSAAVRDPALPLSRLSGALPVPNGWERGAVTPYPRRTIHGLFREQAARTPDAVALTVCGADAAVLAEWRYADLDRASDQLARRLVAAGAGPGTRVLLVLGRSDAGIIATLATLKAGAAYVPVDPAYPSDRIAWMAEDAAVALVVSRAGDSARLPPGVDWLDVDGQGPLADLPVDLLSPDAPACLFYTSGSTGRPKGAVVPHRGLARLVLENGYARFGADLTFLHLSNPAFDAASYEIWGALLHGSRLVVAPPGVSALSTLDQVVRGQQVDCLFLTTGLFNTILDERPGLLAGVSQVLTGGEAMSSPHAERFLALFPDCALINCYGPTECGTYTLTHRVGPADVAGGSVPIGRPIANASLLVLGADGQPVPVNAPGELCIGGDGLALGYWNRPDLTADRFIDRQEGRFYRSGDRVRWRADGALIFLGRIDHQVKLRGFRVEPGEVERAIRDLPGVRQAVVAVRDLGGGPALAAWVVPADADLRAEDVLADLGSRLPAYLLPQAVALLPFLPLTPSGKVDLRALPDPVAATVESAPALTPEEAAVAAAFSALLGRPVGRHDGFFALGGHSLLALRLVSRLADATGVRLPPHAVWEAPTVAALAQRLRQADETIPLPEITPAVPPDQPAPLSADQARLWFFHQLDPQSPVYNMAYALRLDGPLDGDALQAALRDVAARHDVLRMGIRSVDGVPVAFFRNVDSIRLSRESLPDDVAVLRWRVTQEAEKPFDLEGDALLRAVLVALGPDSHALLLTMHHIVSDGWSMGIFADELARFYVLRRDGLAHLPPPLPVRFADFAAGQRQWLAGPERERQMGWWRDRLAGAPPFTPLPTDRPRPAERTNRGACLVRPLAAELSNGLQRLAASADVTPFMVGLASFALLLSRWTGEGDLVIGIPVANRRTRGADELIGFFVNTLAVRLSLDGDPDGKGLLAQVRQTLLDAWRHQDLPFDMVVEAVQPERSLGHTPLFNVMFDLEEGPAPFALDGLAISPLPRQHRLSRFDLTFTLIRQPEGLVANWEFSEDIFDPGTIERMARHWENLLAEIISKPEQPAFSLPMLDATERASLLPPASPAVPGPEMLHHLVAAQALRTPDSPAVTGAGETLSYAALMARADALATTLRRRGVGPGQRVLVLMGRTPGLIAALLGVMRAGAAWVPVDPTQPAERVARIAADATPALALTDAALASLLPAGLERLVLDQAWPQPNGPVDVDTDIDPARPCYVIYTSGSTGEPRGVLIPHRAAAGFVRGATSTHGINAADRVLQFASIAFDAAVEEIFPCLSVGGQLFLRSDEMLASPARFLARCGEMGITVADLPTSFWHDLVLGMVGTDLRPPATLRRVIIGGEAALPDRLAQWQALGLGVTLVNTYGPTEATVVATCCDLTDWQPAAVDPTLVPIGRPLPGVRALVLDPRGEPVPQGVAGELLLGGIGLADGYLGRPEATEKAFITAPWDASERLYRTRDRVRLLPDGQIAFLGRLDHQVKIRGFRVELGEIEAALRRQPGVNAAVVTLDGSSGRPRLLAHLAGNPDVPALKAALRRELPEYMVPCAIMVMEALPINRQGKVDRRSLPPPPEPSVTVAPVALENPLERALATIWQAQLGPIPIGPDDNFFDLGGTSLSLIRVQAAIADQFSPGLLLVDLFRHPTLRSLAARLQAGAAQPAARIDSSAETERRQDGRARLAALRRGRG